MTVGIHFSNRQWEPPAEEAYRRLALARPATIKTCVHGQAGFDQVAEVAQLRERNKELEAQLAAVCRGRQGEAGEAEG